MRSGSSQQPLVEQSRDDHHLQAADAEAVNLEMKEFSSRGQPKEYQRPATWAELLRNDELTQSIGHNQCLFGFIEPEVRRPPHYGGTYYPKV